MTLLARLLVSSIVCSIDCSELFWYLACYDCWLLVIGLLVVAFFVFLFFVFCFFCFFLFLFLFCIDSFLVMPWFFLLVPDSLVASI